MTVVHVVGINWEDPVADVHGYGPTQHEPEWRPHGSYTNAYGEKRQRFRCALCGGTSVTGRIHRPGPRPLRQGVQFDRFWEEVELEFTRVGLPQAVELGCAAAHVSRRTAAQWLKEGRFPAPFPLNSTRTPRRQLLEECLNVGKLDLRRTGGRAWRPNLYEVVRDDPSVYCARSMQFNLVDAWSALLIARGAVSIVQGRPLPEWMFMAPEVSEPWLSLILDFQPSQPGLAPSRNLGESGLRYMLWLFGESAWLRIGTRRRTLLEVRRQFHVPTGLDLQCFLPLSPAGARVEGDSVQIPIIGVRRGGMVSPFFRVPRRWSAALAQVGR